MRLIQFTEKQSSDQMVSSVVELKSVIHPNAWKPKSNGNLPATRQPDSNVVTWLDIDKVSTARILSELGEMFGLHPLALEDVVNVHQHSKADIYGDTLYLVARMPVTSSDEPFDTEQVSIFLRPGLVITFQEKPGDCLDGVRNRLASGAGRVRKMPADYLAYAIFDAILDGYFPRLELLEHELDQLSEKLMGEPEKTTPLALHNIRANLLIIRKFARQHKDAIYSLLRDKSSIISAETAHYFRDCLDHAGQIMEAADIYRETCGELRELFYAGLSQKNNDVMKVLTVIATLFIPMSFVAGVYGMNFDGSVSNMNMPELQWAYGYPFALAVMGLLGGGLLWYMVSKKWL